MRRAIGVSGLVLSVVLAACGGGGGQVGQGQSSAKPAPSAAAATANANANLPPALADAVNAAKKEKLVIVSHPGDPYDQVVQAFQKAYPDIPVEHTAMRPSEFAPKLLTEQKNGVYNWDVWWDATSNMNNVVLPAGGFQDLSPFLLLPDVKDANKWRGGQVIYTSTKQPDIFVHTLVSPGGPFVNRDVMPKDLFPSGQPLNPDQLLDPRLKGKILIRTPSTPEGGSLFLTGILKQKGADFMHKLLVDQQPVFQDNAQLISQAVIQGKAAIEIGGDEPTIQKCRNEGGCKNLDQITQHLYALATGVGVLKNAPHRNAAMVFVNWILSQQGQQTYVDTWSRLHESGADSDRVDVEPKDPGLAVDFNKLDDYSLQGTDQGQALMDQVLKTYKDIASH